MPTCFAPTLALVLRAMRFKKFGNIRLIRGNNLSILPLLPSNSVDAIVTDPPAGISFMGKTWDSNKGGRDKWIAWLEEIARECFRVCKPGGHALVWAIPRTSHWTAMAWENAGWQVRDRVAHLFGQGFPKSLDVSKTIDKALEVDPSGYTKNPAERSGNGPGATTSTGWSKPTRPPKPIATSDDAKQWSGWGTALKPACEDWWLFRKPPEGTVAANVLKYGVGGLNIDGCRVVTDGASPAAKRRETARRTGNVPMMQTTIGVDTAKEAEKLGKIGRRGSASVYTEDRPAEQLGRWPANLVLSHDPRCVQIGTKRVKGSRVEKPCPDPKIGGHRWGTIQGNRGPRGIGDSENKESVEVWACVPGCAVRMLDDQAGERKSGKPGNAKRNTFSSFLAHGGGVQLGGYGDSGSVSRFFYCAKASRKEREAGLDELSPISGYEAVGRKEGTGGLKSPRAGAGRTASKVRNTVPTVKPINLMRWLVRLVTPPKGVVLDPFMGSGTTGIACVKERFGFVGLEKGKRTFRIATARIRHARKVQRGKHH